MLNNIHNASSLNEQKIIKQKFSDEDILVTKDNIHYYVKGRLQPTRVIIFIFI